MKRVISLLTTSRQRRALNRARDQAYANTCLKKFAVEQLETIKWVKRKRRVRRKWNAARPISFVRFISDFTINHMGDHLWNTTYINPGTNYSEIGKPGGVKTLVELSSGRIRHIEGIKWKWLPRGYGEGIPDNGDDYLLP